MPSKLYSATRLGMETKTVEVEVDVAQGLHSFSIVGMGDKAISEAKERISSALKNSSFKPPRSFNKRVVVNLAPADVKKEGVLYDVPMALGFLLDSEQVKPAHRTDNTLVVGEVGLNGVIRPVKGAILYTLHAKEQGFTTIIVPKENEREASLIQGVEVVAANTVQELVDHLEDRKPIRPSKHTKPPQSTAQAEHDFALIQGQEHAKKALEIAAAGGHNIMFHGPPGSGKTLLARSAIGLLPPLSYEEALELTKIESVAGGLSGQNAFVRRRPFRAPHHASSESAIIGGGSHLNPGEISRAHRGILFLDEFPEFHRDVLESLRQPIESGTMTVARAKGSVEYPAHFMLVAAANPCPCGYFGDKERECNCNTGSIIRYQRKISGPIADRIDLHVHVPRQKYEKLSSDERAESSEQVRKRVMAARERQKTRFARQRVTTNKEMQLNHIKRFCNIDASLSNKLGAAIEKYRLSGRGYHSVLKVARTVADLRGSETIEWSHLAVALQYAKRDTQVL